MARLQGHFLKYKDDPVSQLANVKELLDEDDDTGGMEEMTIIEWLRRLNLVQHVTHFKKK